MIAGYYSWQESNLSARQPRRAPHHVIGLQATTSEGRSGVVGQGWLYCPRSLRDD